MTHWGRRPSIQGQRADSGKHTYIMSARRITSGGSCYSAMGCSSRTRDELRATHSSALPPASEHFPDPSLRCIPIRQE